MFRWLKSLLNVKTIEAGIQALKTRGRPIAKAVVFVVETLIAVGEELIQILLARGVVGGLKLVL